MKKGILALLALLNGTFLIAQTEFDALKYVQPDINGTAKYMSMAGAFGALGGDASAIKDNAASLGIYRNSEVVGTTNLLMQKTSADWNNAKGTGNLYKLGFNNFSIVIALPTKRSQSGTKGLLSSNFSFGYNRLKDFSRSLNIKSQSDTSSMADYIASFTGNIKKSDLTYTNSYDPFITANIPWISVLASNGGLITESVNSVNGKSSWSSILGNSETVIPSYILTEKGFIDEYALSWAGNINNFIYFGATANIQAINYSGISKYSEVFSKGGGMNLIDTIYTKGNGINFNIGTIICPLKFLRIGLSVLTPTVYSLKDNYYSKLNDSISTPGGINRYQLKSPLQLNASLAYIIGTKATISAEYNFSNTTGTQLMDENGKIQDYAVLNQRMKEKFKNIQTIKIGAEFYFDDNFSGRAGYANISNANLPEEEIQPAKIILSNLRTDTEYILHNSTNYITLGFGYHKASWSVDFAFINKTINESFYPYDSNIMAYKAKEAKIITSNNNLVLSLGYRF